MKVVAVTAGLLMMMTTCSWSWLVSSDSDSNLLINRNNFPEGFIFGAGSSAYQLEGATNSDGRKPSIWDTFVRQYPEKISDHSTGDVADEFYYHYKEDIALMKEIGLDSFRFSISWPRILPGGKVSRGVNQEGVDFYNSLIDELLSNGIQPFVTLFHGDLPQTLEDEYGGFLSPDIVNDYRDYVDFCFNEFGDRVKHWVTLNEPNLFAKCGYADGTTAPGRCSDYIGNCTPGNSATEPYLVAHHLILSHATAVKLYRDKYKGSQNGTIGITVETYWMIPKYETVVSQQAASRALDFAFGWIVHPITYGDYPKIMRVMVGNRLPHFTEEESRMIRGSIDFLGINYYTARYVDDCTSCPTGDLHLSYSTDSHVNETDEKNGVPIGEPTGASWLYIYPDGIRQLVLYVKRKYMNPPIYITENGMADFNNKTLPIMEALNDSLRIKYHSLHLTYLLKAIKDGADVRGYYVWSFLDDFEWEFGYTERYGVTYVDFKNNLKRYFKRSTFWFKNFLAKDNIANTSFASM
ncbi:hypothetical protein SLA2020_334590 [Shorea laevis]